MGCHYCNEWAGRTLGDKVVCEDCYQTIKAVPDEDRSGVILNRLQKVHGMLLSVRPHTGTGYLNGWMASMAGRINFLMGNAPVATRQAPLPSIRKAPKKGLKIKKFGGR